MSRAGTGPQPGASGAVAVSPPVPAGAAEVGAQPGVSGAVPSSVPGAADGMAVPGLQPEATGEPGPGAPVSAEGSPGKGRRPPWRGWEPTLRVAGIVVAVLASFVTGVLELLLSTMRAGDVTAVWRGDAIGSGGGPLIGVSILLAAVLNYAIAWFAVATTGRKWAAGPPWALWTLLMLFAAGVGTAEGDRLLAGNNWVALVTILVGSLSYAVYSYRMILARAPR